MGLSTPELSVEIAVSTMDLYPYDMPGWPSWGSNVEQLVPFLEATGCRNFEVHPTNSLLCDIEDRVRGDDVELVELVVGSLHQTFNEGGDLLGRVADRRGVQRSTASIAGMMTIQTALSRPIPSVHYLTRPLSYYPLPITTEAEPNYPGSFPVVQPGAELYRDFGLHSNTALLAMLKENGVVGLCPDTVHARRQAEDGTTTPAIAEVWADQFSSGRVFEMHVSADRLDMGKRDRVLAEKSHREFSAFTSRHWRWAQATELGEMIMSAIEHWVPPAELSRVVGRPILRQVIEIPPLPGGYVRRVSQHVRFVENLAELIREAGAEPLLWGNAA